MANLSGLRTYYLGHLSLNLPLINFLIWVDPNPNPNPNPNPPQAITLTLTPPFAEGSEHTAEVRHTLGYSLDTRALAEVRHTLG